MSKSKLKPEDIFFGLQKTIAAENSEERETVITQPTEEKKPATKQPRKSSAKTTVSNEAPAKKKRGPAPDPNNQRRVAVNVLVSPETKYQMQLLINEMKLRGFVERYSMTDFVAEAIDEKIKKDKKKFGLD